MIDRSFHVDSRRPFFLMTLVCLFSGVGVACSKVSSEASSESKAHVSTSLGEEKKQGGDAPEVAHKDPGVKATAFLDPVRAPSDPLPTSLGKKGKDMGQSLLPSDSTVAASFSGSHYTVELISPSSCKVSETCVANIVLTSNDGFHINQSYPYRFIADDASSLSFDVEDGKSFSKDKGDFLSTSPETGVMRVKYRGTEKGPTKISGAFQMSVCSASSCQLEKKTVALDISII